MCLWMSEQYLSWVGDWSSFWWLEMSFRFWWTWVLVAAEWCAQVRALFASCLLSVWPWINQSVYERHNQYPHRVCVCVRVVCGGPASCTQWPRISSLRGDYRVRRTDSVRRARAVSVFCRKTPAYVTVACRQSECEVVALYFNVSLKLPPLLWVKFEQNVVLMQIFGFKSFSIC